MRIQDDRRLIIHAGMHKTASTTLQVALYRNRAALAKVGIVYPTPPQGHAQHYLLSGWNPQLQTTYPPILSPEDDWQAINDIGGTEPVTVILSSEEFSRRSPTRIDFEEIVSRTPSFDHHEIIVVLRDQISLLQSVFLQIRQGNTVSNFPEWLRQATDSAHNPGLFFDYYQLHAHLTKAFTADQISYLPYDTFNDHELGVMGTFLEHLRYDNVPGLKAVDRRNVSIDPLGYYLCRDLLEGSLPTKQQLELVRSMLLDRHPDKQKTSLYTKAEIETLSERFQSLNKPFEEAISQSLHTSITMPKVKSTTLYRCEVTDADRHAISRFLATQAE
jgi:hypothetical protein